MPQNFTEPALPTPLTPLHSEARRAGQRRPVSLLVWHDIVPEEKLVWFDTTATEFDAQLDQLVQAGVRPITLDALYSYLATGRPLPPPGAAVLCFDDNTMGIHDLAFPRLKDRGWPLAVSVHSKYVGVRTGKDHCDWRMLQNMAARGAAQIVSQTHTHPADLRALSDAALWREFAAAKMALEQGLDLPVRYVTYPSGKWDARVARAAARCGYRMGLTEDGGAAEASPHLLGVRRYSTHRRFAEAVRAVARSTAGKG